MAVSIRTHDLGVQARGATVVVHLGGSPSYVRLLAPGELTAFKTGRTYRTGDGGLATLSPYRMHIPEGGHWYVVVEPTDKNVRSRSTVHVDPPTLKVPADAPQPPLSAIRHELPPQVSSAEETWDVFVSHASEDKEAVAEPLYRELHARGLKPWLDIVELRIGDGLRQRIDYGLARSRFGVVILSPSFFAKGWPQYELDAIVTRSIKGEQTLLPIWHQVTEDDVLARSPSLVNKVARSTGQYSIAEIAAEIAEVVHGTGM